MPLCNFRWLIALAVLCVLCYLSAPRTRYSRVLADNFDSIARRYYRPLSETGLFEDAVNGMMSQKRLDKNSRYIPADDKPEFDNDLNQEFVGIGIRESVDPKTKQLVVLSPLLDGPAVAAGVRAGDRILRIDGQSTHGMSLESASTRIKGPAGSPVKISVQHRGAAQAVELAIVRRVVHEDTVEGASRAPDGRWGFFLRGPRDSTSPRIGYVWLKSFVEADGGAKSTAADLRAALEEVRRENARGLVLDLRDNRGGSLKAAIDVCDLLVVKGQIVTMRGRDRQVLRAYRASGKAAFADIPIAVLVNGLSASASEIVAACLQDNGRAIVVGQRSYGKGTVQEVIELGPALGAMKLTVATYWRPSGQDINRPADDGKDVPWGVSPDQGYEVPVADDERRKLITFQDDRELAAVTGAKPPAEVPDRVLQKALVYLEARAR
jgi:carboxyl-terminal processing protease